MKLASVFGVGCIGFRWCPHDWSIGIVSLHYALVALTRSALYRAASSVYPTLQRLARLAEGGIVT